MIPPIRGNHRPPAAHKNNPATVLRVQIIKILNNALNFEENVPLTQCF